MSLRVLKWPACPAMCADNLNTTQIPEYTKDKYNAKIIK
jgi:hypothetical protein